MQVRSRQQLIFGLVGVFFVQTFFVYTDPAGRRTPRLSELASRGQAVWFENNCQSCHQLYGFGGFLGPDLTNAAKRLTPSRLEAILTLGSDRMPAFGLSADDRSAVASFLEEMDRTGVSQPKLGEALPARELLERLVETASKEEALTATEAEGRTIVFEQNCIDCHLPNGRSAYRAPDLTRAALDNSPDYVRTVLAEGVPDKGMPRLGLSADERESVLAFLEFLGRHGAPMRNGFESSEQRAAGSFPLPAWFEYPER